MAALSEQTVQMVVKARQMLRRAEENMRQLSVALTAQAIDLKQLLDSGEIDDATYWDEIERWQEAFTTGEEAKALDACRVQALHVAQIAAEDLVKAKKKPAEVSPWLIAMAPAVYSAIDRQSDDPQTFDVDMDHEAFFSLDPFSAGKRSLPVAGEEAVRVASDASKPLHPLLGKVPLTVAYGMGVDSTAMLVGFHQRGIKPDLILFADTGSEKPETYAYLDVIQRWLASVRFPPVIVVRYSPQRFKNDPYSTLEGNCISNSTLPSLAFGRKSCSLKWKKAPQDKYIDHWPPAERTWAAGDRVLKAIGYDAGPKDAKRAWDLADDDKYVYWYPLRGWEWDREVCEREIARAGLPVPPKSACFFCPSTQPHELLELADTSPELARRIVAMEAKALPNLQQIEGLWRKATKKRPGTMTAYLQQHRPHLFDVAASTTRERGPSGR